MVASTITIPAQHSEAVICGPLECFQFLVESTSRCSAAGQLLAMFRTIIVDMIEGQEIEFAFSAARTTASVLVDGFRLQFAARHTLLLSAVSAMFMRIVFEWRPATHALSFCSSAAAVVSMVEPVIFLTRVAPACNFVMWPLAASRAQSGGNPLLAAISIGFGSCSHVTIIQGAARKGKDMSTSRGVSA